MLSISASRVLTLCFLALLLVAPAENFGADKVRTPSDRAVISALNDASKALAARAGELKIKGVGVVAYAEGDSITAWTSKMVVVGSLAMEPKGDGKGANLLAIAYAKASEMASTLKDSGSKVRAPFTGEVGWQGGVIARGRSGFLIAAFSGGPSADDVKASQAAIEVLARRL
ncbi:MAG: hypothetical protein FJ405_17075 [Verrucomicrobia bacterium]|nr:hypothetical protein [Verrucomicrobiota bacterium]